MEKALVLGSSGFLGQYLTAELKSRGVEVTGYDRSDPAGDATDHFVQGDFALDTHFPQLLADGRFDVVYHLISTTVPAPGTANALREVVENIAPTVRLLEAMKNTGAEMVFVSSGGTVYGESQGQPHRSGDPMRPICSYGMQKAAIEQFLQLYDGAGEVRCKICRVSNPYGVMPQQGRTQGIIPILLRCLLNGQPIALYGETVRDYIFISDVTAALIAAADYSGSENVFNVGSGVGMGLHALARLLEERSGLTFSVVDQQPIRTCDVSESVLDISDTIRLLDWTPRVSLVEGVDWTLKALRAVEV